jgi:beta-mannosidase
MKTTHDLSSLPWKLSPFVPHFWQFAPFAEMEACPEAQIIPAKVPGSVQRALLDAGLLPDWNVGQAARACEWVENRHWMYETVLPDAWCAEALPGGAGDAGGAGGRPLACRLVCDGLDYKGWVFLNGKQAGEFCGTHLAWRFDLAPFLQASHNVLRIVFDLPPRWLGQFGYSSRMREWKVRFNYTWDWSPRLVQVGISGAIGMELSDGNEIDCFRCVADAELPASGATAEARPRGVLRMGGRIPSGAGTVRATLRDGNRKIRAEDIPAARFAATGVAWHDLAVELWQPNGVSKAGQSQPLYELQCELLDESGAVHDTVERRIGFRHVEWRQCEGAPANSDPWLCVVNGVPLFLQGVNYPPVLPNWADVTREDHRKRLQLCRDLGMNMLRINACQFLESQDFYELCDEYGIMVWQEMPLTSSGVENTPPDDSASIDAVCRIARSFVTRRQHHPSLVMWSGGNELLDRDMKPYDAGHPMLAALERVIEEEDPTRRYIPTSPSGPRWGIEEAYLGKGLHWDVHGPWKPQTDLTAWKTFWKTADALFYSEIGAPGASPAPLIRRYAGGLPVLPVHPKNPLYCLTLSWWTEHVQFEAEHGHAPRTLEEYVTWSQARQAETLVVAVRACKERFPRCGGVLLWCGHDCFPCAVNTSIIDFEGNPKPAALALAAVWKEATR